MQKSFEAVVQDALAWLKENFGARVRAVYLHGSIAMGDAVEGLSDADFYVVLRDELSDADKILLKSGEKMLQAAHSVVDGVHLSAHSMKELGQDSFARFVLKYNAKLIDGGNMVGLLDLTNEKMEPDAVTAKGRLAFARQCFEEALAGKQPACTGEIPEDPCYAARKFARYFVVIEGAYYLMSKGAFFTFEKDVVMDSLREEMPQYVNVLNTVHDVLKDAKKAGVSGAELLQNVREMVHFMFDEIEKA